jgi:MFS family permease
MILASYSLTAAGVASLYGRIASAIAMRGRIALAALGLGAGGLVMATVHGGAYSLALGCIITGAGAGLVEPVTVSLALQHSPQRLHTRAIGLLLSFVFLGQFLNPLLIDPLRSIMGIHGAFIVVAGVFAAMAGLALAGGLGRLANPGDAALGATPQSTPR